VLTKAAKQWRKRFLLEKGGAAGLSFRSGQRRAMYSSFPLGKSGKPSKRHKKISL